MKSQVTLVEVWSLDIWILFVVLMIASLCNEESGTANDLGKAPGLHTAAPWARFAGSY